MLFLARGVGDYVQLGEALDDSPGEAFDKERGDAWLSRGSSHVTYLQAPTVAPAGGADAGAEGRWV